MGWSPSCSREGGSAKLFEKGQIVPICPGFNNLAVSHTVNGYSASRYLLTRGWVEAKWANVAIVSRKYRVGRGQPAYHYDSLAAVEQAINYLLKAREKARRAYLNDEAIGYFQRALTRLDLLNSPSKILNHRLKCGVWRR